MAIIVFGVASTGLAAMTFWVGVNTVQISGSAGRAAALARESDRLSTVPFETLHEGGTCVERRDDAFAYIQCVRVEELSPAARRVTVIVNPKEQRVRPDTLVMERIRATPYNPLQ